MPINSIGNTTVVSMNNIRQERIELSKFRNNLSQNISDIKNCVTVLNKSITAYKKILPPTRHYLKVFSQSQQSMVRMPLYV